MKQEVVFYSDGAKIVGDMYVPEPYAEGDKCPVIILCHGFSGIREILLPAYAEAFATAGYLSLVFDYRGFGDSEGERGRLIPSEQVVDIRNAITFMEVQPEADAERIGLWGTSFGGANAITTASIDERVKCLTVQITFGSGERMVAEGLSEDEKAKILSTLKKAWQRAVVRNKPMMLNMDQILTDEDSKTFYNETVIKHPKLKTRLPITTIKESLEYKPENCVSSIKVPILVIGADQDIVCPVEESKILYEKANEPKELFIIEGAKHYDVYEGENFKVSSEKQLDWYNQYLK